VGGLFKPERGRNEADLAALRSTLKQRVLFRSNLIAVSYYTFEELALIYSKNSDHYLRTIDFLLHDLAVFIINGTDTLLKKEATLGRPLRFHECSSGPRDPDRARVEAILRDPQSIDTISPLVEESKAFYERDAKTKRDLVSRQFSDLDIHLIFGCSRRNAIKKATRWWGKQAIERHLDEWVLSAKKNLIKGGILPESAEDLGPSELFSLRRFTEYQMIRMIRNVSHEAKIKGSDFFDFHQYVASGYCDLFICDDGEFRTSCEKINRSVSVLGFDEFRSRLERGLLGRVAASTIGDYIS
jgi:hypothetical protein